MVRKPGASVFGMRLIAITGGIGSGKSTVAQGLVAHGAVLVDADAIVKELQEPGTDVFNAMVERWGEGIVADDGSLDRAAVAAIVFADEQALTDLNELVHPAVRTEMAARIDVLAETDAVVLQDIPLLAESKRGPGGASAVVVVDCPVEVAIQRLIDYRSFDRADAEARVAAQASREDRRALADFVIDNGGTPTALAAEIDRCWTWIQTLPATPWPPVG